MKQKTQNRILNIFLVCLALAVIYIVGSAAIEQHAIDQQRDALEKNCRAFLDLRYKDEGYVIGVTRFNDNGLCCGEIAMTTLQYELDIKTHCSLIAKGFGG